MLVCWCNTGDSISASASTWPYQYLGVASKGDAGVPAAQAGATYISGNVIAKNMAVAGTRLNTMGYPDVVPLALVDVDPIVAVKSLSPRGSGASVAPSRRYVFSCAIGSNDAATGGLGSPEAYADAVGACAALRRAAGFDLLVLATLLPRGSILTEPNRLAYNARIKNAAFRATYGIDGIFDFASDPIMGDPASLTDPTYYDEDEVHPTAAGQALLVPYVASVMSALGAEL